MDYGSKPAVVMDCGTGYTKMGFAGNVQVSPQFDANHRPVPPRSKLGLHCHLSTSHNLPQPSFAIPTAITSEWRSTGPRHQEQLPDLDCLIGTWQQAQATALLSSAA